MQFTLIPVMNCNKFFLANFTNKFTKLENIIDICNRINFSEKIF